jgi:hypothetical protein
MGLQNYGSHNSKIFGIPSCEIKNMPQLLILPLFSPFGVIIESIKEFGGALIDGVLKYFYL